MKRIKDVCLIILIITTLVLIYININTPSPTSITITTIDTAYVTKTNTIVKKVLVKSVDTSYIIKEDIRFIPDTSYGGLKKQFESLSKEFTKKTTYIDTLLLDSIGYVHVLDTVQFNTLINRRYHYEYNLPVVTNTITHYPKPTRQLYFGGGLNSLNLHTGLLYKTKKDRLIGINIGVYNSKPVYGFQIFIPIIK